MCISSQKKHLEQCLGCSTRAVTNTFKHINWTAHNRSCLRGVCRTVWSSLRRGAVKQWWSSVGPLLSSWFIVWRVTSPSLVQVTDWAPPGPCREFSSESTAYAEQHSLYPPAVQLDLKNKLDFHITQENNLFRLPCHRWASHTANKLSCDYSNS